MKRHRLLLGLCLSAAMLAPGCGRQLMPEVSDDPSQEAANRTGRKRQQPANKVETKGEVREWQSGESTFRASIVEVKGDKVSLLIEGSGDVRTIPISKFSAADQQYIRQAGGGG
jgi:hypothetical protein